MKPGLHSSFRAAFHLASPTATLPLDTWDVCRSLFSECSPPGLHPSFVRRDRGRRPPGSGRTAACKSWTRASRSRRVRDASRGDLGDWWAAGWGPLSRKAGDSTPQPFLFPLREDPQKPIRPFPPTSRSEVDFPDPASPGLSAV